MKILLLVLGGVAAVAIGFWLGLPGRYEQTQEDIEKAMDRGGARRNQVKRVFTPLDWLRKDKRGSQRRIDAGRRRFRTAAPERQARDQEPGRQADDRQSDGGEPANGSG